MQVTQQQTNEAKLSIRLAITAEEVRQVYRLRYEVYQRDLNPRGCFVDNGRKWLANHLDLTASLLGAWDGDRLVGTIRCNLLRETSSRTYVMAMLPKAVLGHSSMTSGLVVDPEYGGTTLGFDLACAAYIFCSMRGASADFIECDTFAIDSYERLGYRTYRRFHHPHRGHRVIMRLEMSDIVHLKRVQSPFCRYYSEICKGGTTAAL